MLICKPFPIYVPYLPRQIYHPDSDEELTYVRNVSVYPLAFTPLTFPSSTQHTHTAFIFTVLLKPLNPQWGMGPQQAATPTTTPKNNGKYNSCTLECIGLSTSTELALKLEREKTFFRVVGTTRT